MQWTLFQKENNKFQTIPPPHPKLNTDFECKHEIQRSTKCLLCGRGEEGEEERLKAILGATGVLPPRSQKICARFLSRLTLKPGTFPGGHPRLFPVPSTPWRNLSTLVNPANLITIPGRKMKIPRDGQGNIVQKLSRGMNSFFSYRRRA